MDTKSGEMPRRNMWPRSDMRGPWLAAVFSGTELTAVGEFPRFLSSLRTAALGELGHPRRSLGRRIPDPF
jgi:hypothetical protein